MGAISLFNSGKFGLKLDFKCIYGLTIADFPPVKNVFYRVEKDDNTLSLIFHH